ncbi:rod shape-determining protein MreD [Ornithinibacillus sp. 4-3]|uniref:Rod shape-determining protein MreD n=1 Tax=Ornithinibacillus sp. 4-3 TaxID=3231488 RepID=A0AB39HN61_9BACI
MKRLLLPLILFLLTVLEGVALDLLPTSIVTGSLFIIPHWVFILLFFIAIFYDRENTGYAILYAIIFGLLIDLVYTGVLGIYMFTYAFVIYLVHEIRKLVLNNFYVTVILGIFGMILVDIGIYLIYSVIGIAHLMWTDYLLYRLLPTVTANIAFLLILYPFARKVLLKWSKEQLQDHNAF